jgi:DNA polymerase
MPDLMFIGEAPGATEDQEGRPFIGKSGLILTEMISSLGLERGQVFITNIIKCRPPNNRPPRPNEIDACLPYLERQIKILRPKIIVLMGNIAMLSMLGMKGMGGHHGKTYERNGIKFFVTCHPAASFGSGGWKRAMIEDFEILDELRDKE